MIEFLVIFVTAAFFIPVIAGKAVSFHINRKLDRLIAENEAEEKKAAESAPAA